MVPVTTNQLKIHDKNGQFPISKERTYAVHRERMDVHSRSSRSSSHQFPPCGWLNGWTSFENHTNHTPKNFRILWELSVPPNPLQNPSSFCYKKCSHLKGQNWPKQLSVLPKHCTLHVMQCQVIPQARLQCKQDTTVCLPLWRESDSAKLSELSHYRNFSPRLGWWDILWVKTHGFPVKIFPTKPIQ